jgi:hypothetical protein
MRSAGGAMTPMRNQHGGYRDSALPTRKVRLWQLRDDQFEVADGRLTGVRLTLSPGREPAVVDPRRRSRGPGQRSGS